MIVSSRSFLKEINLKVSVQSVQGGVRLVGGG